MTLTGAEVVAASILFVLVPIGTALACLKLSRRPIRVRVCTPATLAPQQGGGAEVEHEIVLPEVESAGHVRRARRALVDAPLSAARSRRAARRERGAARRLDRQFLSLFDAGERGELEARFRVVETQGEVPSTLQLRRLRRRGVQLEAVTLPVSATPGAVLHFRDGSVVRLRPVDPHPARLLQTEAGRGGVRLVHVECASGLGETVSLRFRTLRGPVTLEALPLT